MVSPVVEGAFWALCVVPGFCSHAGLDPASSDGGGSTTGLDSDRA
jgi:hypothetical protein